MTEVTERRTARKIPHIIKSIYEKLTANIILNGEKSKQSC